MLISKKNNKGFSLVEVIVSMLVLSIVISSVLTAFSLSAKANAKTKKLQAAESLMEDLMELAGAVKDSSQYVDKVEAYLGGSKGSSTWTDSNTIETCTVSGVNKGSYSYDIEIVRDTEPDDYATMNGSEMITFGESGNQSVLVDASTKGNQFLGSDVHGYDKMAFDYFVSLRNDKIRTDNLGLETPQELIDPDNRDDAENLALLTEIEGYIDRDVYFEVVSRPPDKMELIGYFSYEVSSSLDLVAGTVRTIEYPFFWSGEFSKGSDTDPGANKIDSVYVLYSPCSYESRNAMNNVDVRIWDPSELLNADVYLVWQEETASVDSVLNKTLEVRFPSDGEGEQNIEVCFAKKGAVASEQPGRVDLYSPVRLSCSDLSSSNGSVNSYKMVPTKNEARIQTLSIKIKDSDGNVVASEDEFACLQ